MLVEAPTRLPALAPAGGGLELVMRASPAPVIAVAGASGKSTTAALVGDILHASGFGVALGLRAALQALDALTADDRVIVELSSTAAVAARTGPAFLVLTGLAADELPPGQSATAFTRTLRPIVAATSQAIVVNADDDQAIALAAAASAPVRRASTADASADVSMVDGTLIARDFRSGGPHSVYRVGNTALAGPGLTTDLVVAVAAALSAGADLNAIEGAIRGVAPLPDRQEALALRGGVAWVSDALATRPGRTAVALARHSGPLLLIAGGRSGGQPLDNWATAATGATYVLLYGPAGESMTRALVDHASAATIVRCADLDDAVMAASHLAERGDTVLFSPGCEPESSRGPSPAERFRDLATMPRSARVAA